MSSSIVITPQVVKSVIESRFKLNQLPLNAELRDFDLSPNDLLQMRSQLNTVFGIDVEIKMHDTIYSITDNMLAV